MLGLVESPESVHSVYKRDSVSFQLTYEAEWVDLRDYFETLAIFKMQC